MRPSLFPCLVLFLALRSQVAGERILMIAQAPFYSHENVMRSFSVALHKRGHEIVLVTPFPRKEPTLANYTEIDVSVNLNTIRDLDLFAFFADFKGHGKLRVNELLQQSVYDTTDWFYSHPDVRKIYTNSAEKFDLVIAEGLCGHGIFYIAHKLNAPLISMISVDLHMMHYHLSGSPLLPSHLSSFEFYDNVKPSMSFWTRLENFVHAWLLIRQWYNFEVGRLHSMVRSHLGDDVPSFDEIARNTSLLLANYDPLIGYARPLPPNVISFSGVHIVEDPPPLPTPLREFLGNASDGFVYMSLGTTVNSSTLSPDVIDAIFNVLSRLPYKVLYKYEGDDASRKRPNVFTSKWIPQQSVLACRNIKLFIYQGGLQSTEETIHHGVPIVGIPLLFEQVLRVRKLVSLGIGRLLDFAKLNEETFQEAVIDVLDNESYKTNVLRLRRLVKDKPYDSKEHAAWWVEYVMRHKGAPHLRFSGADDPWYQRFDMDVVAFLSITSFLLVIACTAIFIQVLRCWLDTLYRSPTRTQKTDKVE